MHGQTTVKELVLYVKPQSEVAILKRSGNICATFFSDSAIFPHKRIYMP